MKQICNVGFGIWALLILACPIAFSYIGWVISTMPGIFFNSLGWTLFVGGILVDIIVITILIGAWQSMAKKEKK